MFSKIKDTDRVTLADDAPEWLKAAVRDAHQGDFPNDWIYAECAAAYEELAAGLNEDSAHEYIDSRVEIYTKDLYQWAAGFCLTNTFAAAEEQAKDAGIQGSIHDQLSGIQYYAIDFIVHTIMQAHNESH